MCAKGRIRKVKEQPTEWKKYLQIMCLIRDLYAVYKEFLEISKKTNNPIFKWAKDMNRYFSRKRYTNGQ